MSVFAADDYLIIILNLTDTTVSTNNEFTYDRIVITSSAREDFTGFWGVLRFDQLCGFADLGLKAHRVSDHYPVWAAFYVGRDTD